jgi:hypothetical protein
MKQWTDEDTRKLRRLQEMGASPARAALTLRFSKRVVIAKARELGIPFLKQRDWRKRQREREAAARAKAGLPEMPP